MSATMRLWVVMAAAGLGGCAAGTVEGADYPPTISYDLEDRDEFERAREQAERWCSDNFGRGARLVSESDYDDADDRVTFECFVD